MFDLAKDPSVKRLIPAFWNPDKPVAAVCHGPAALLYVQLDGAATLLEGRTVTWFTKTENAADMCVECSAVTAHNQQTFPGQDNYRDRRWNTLPQTRTSSISRGKLQIEAY